MAGCPRILLTNDDGIHAPGLRFLWEALKDFAELTIVAPAKEQSGVGLCTTMRKPLQIEKMDWRDGFAWSVTGTPVDCVKMAVSVILKEQPDLIVSGINRGSNAGRNVLYSGTVGGVIEGVLRNIPGVAVSSVELVNPDYSIAARHIGKIVQHVLKVPLPSGTFLNVNFPSRCDEEIKGLRLARQGKGYWMEDPDARLHPEGATYFWLGGKLVSFEEERDSDVALLQEGYATAVPVHVGELTDLQQLKTYKDAFEKIF